MADLFALLSSMANLLSLLGSALIWPKSLALYRCFFLPFLLLLLSKMAAKMLAFELLTLIWSLSSPLLSSIE